MEDKEELPHVSAELKRAEELASVSVKNMRQLWEEKDKSVQSVKKKPFEKRNRHSWFGEQLASEIKDKSAPSVKKKPFEKQNRHSWFGEHPASEIKELPDASAQITDSQELADEPIRTMRTQPKFAFVSAQTTGLQEAVPYISGLTTQQPPDEVTQTSRSQEPPDELVKGRNSFWEEKTRAMEEKSKKYLKEQSDRFEKEAKQREQEIKKDLAEMAAWDTFVQTAKCREAKMTALEAYDEVMTNLLVRRLPCDEGEVLRSHSISQNKSRILFEEETNGINSTTIEKYLKELTKATNQKLVTMKDTNERKTREFCENLLSELKRQHLDPVLQRVRGKAGAKVSFREIDIGCSKTEMEYKRRAVGAKDVCDEVFFKLQQRLGAEVGQYKEILENLKDYEAQINDLTQQDTEQAEEKKREHELLQRYKLMFSRIQSED